MHPQRSEGVGIIYACDLAITIDTAWVQNGIAGKRLLRPPTTQRVISERGGLTRRADTCSATRDRFCRNRRRSRPLENQDQLTSEILLLGEKSLAHHAPLSLSAIAASQLPDVDRHGS